MYRVIIFCLVLGLVSCKDGCNSSSSAIEAEITHENFVPDPPKEHIGDNVNMEEVIARKGGNILTQACTLVSAKVVAEALGKTPQEVQLRNATPPTQNPTQSACFYKWEDFDFPNAGIFLQLVRNPFADEYPDYISTYVESYRLKGEQAVEAEPIYFKVFEGFGDDGSYSTEAGKYYWRLGETVSFLVAFNTTHNPKEQYRIATILAKEMTNNYLK